MLRKIPLRAAHELLGANFGELNGWEVPISYVDASDKRDFALTTVGIIDLSYFGKVKVFGEESEMFLNALLTNDILPLAIGDAIYSALLDRKGKMLSDMWVIKENEGFIILVEPGMESKLLTIFNESVISEMVEFQDVTDEFGLIGVYGPESGQILIDLFAKIGESVSDTSDTLRLKTPGGGLTLFMSTRLGCLGYDLLFHRSKVDEMWASLLSLGVKAFGLAGFESIRIESGVPRYGFDLSVNTIPLEANLINAISYSKGCYIGQEVISRVSHIGQANKRLAQIRLDTHNHEPGTRIFSDGQEVGSLTSTSGKTALGYIRREYAKVGAKILVKSDTDESNAVVSRII